MTLQKLDVPPVLLRYYKDSGSPLSLSAYIEHHHNLYIATVPEGKQAHSLQGWMRTYLADTYRQAPPQEANHGHQ